MGFENLSWQSILGVGTGLVLSLWLLGRWYRLWQASHQNYIFSLANYRRFKWQEMVTVGGLAMAALALGMAIWGPAWGEKTTKSEKSGADVMMVLDVSKSMMTEDMSQGGEVMDRLMAAKKMIADYVIKHPEHRYGLIVFAGEAFVSSPLTLDTNAYLTFLEGVSYRDIGKQGTDLDEAVGMGLMRLASGEKERGKVMVVLSDGGDEGESQLGTISEQVQAAGVRVVTVGIGSEEGGFIPEGKDMFGRSVYKTYQGEQVITKLNEQPLKNLADKSGGIYFRVRRLNELKQLDSVIAAVKQSNLQVAEGQKRENRYQWLVTVAMFFILLSVAYELFVPVRNKHA